MRRQGGPGCKTPTAKKIFGRRQNPDVNAQKEWSRAQRKLKVLVQHVEDQVSDKLTQGQRKTAENKISPEGDSEIQSWNQEGQPNKSQESQQAQCRQIWPQRRRSRRCQQRRVWKKRRKALARSMRRVGCHMNHANQLVGDFGVRLERQYAFLADPSLPLWKNVKN